MCAGAAAGRWLPARARGFAGLKAKGYQEQVRGFPIAKGCPPGTLEAATVRSISGAGKRRKTELSACGERTPSI